MLSTARIHRKLARTTAAVLVAISVAMGAGLPAGAATQPAATELSQATEAFPAYVRTLGTAGQRASTVAPSAAGIYGAVSYSSGGYSGWLRIARYRDGRWTGVTTVPLQGTSVDNRSTPVTSSHLTGSRFPDFGVVLELGTTGGLQEVTAAGGHWRTLHFIGGHGGVVASDVVGGYLSSSISGRDLTLHWQDCNPDCADGHAQTTVYRYGARSHQLVAISG